MSTLKQLANSDSTFKRLFGRVAPLHSTEAFAGLYTRTHLSVYRYIYGLHGGPAEDVEDLTAEAFARAWQARDRFVPFPRAHFGPPRPKGAERGKRAGASRTGDEDAALGWLLKIARRLVIDTYRRPSVRGLPEPLDESAFAAPTGNSEEQVIANEQLQQLWASLHALSIEQREMLVLRYLLSWRVNAIAEYLALSENTVSVTIRRALAKLRAAWPQAPAEV